MRVAFVGSGWAVRNIWLPCVVGTSGCEAIGVVEPDRQVFEALSTELDLQHFESIAEMLKAKPDLVIIASPNHLHARQAIEVMEGLVNVLVEKPAVLNAKEAMDLITVAKKSGAGLWVSRASLERDDIREVRRLVSSGELGTIRCIDAWWVRAQGIPGRGGWFTDKLRAGGGVGVDLGTHMLEVALNLLDYPVPINAISNLSSDQPAKNLQLLDATWRKSELKSGVSNVETQLHGAVLFDVGQIIRLSVAWASHRSNDETGLVVWGSEGEVELKTTFGFSTQSLTNPKMTKRVNGVTTDITPDRTNPLAPYQRFFELVRDGVVDKKPPSPNAINSLSRTLEMLYAPQIILSQTG